MKLIILCAVFMVILLQEAASKPTKTGLRCHVCLIPNCKIHNEQDCKPDQDTCQKSTTKIIDGEEEKNNYYAATNQGVSVWERLCTTKSKCEMAKKKNGRLTVSCCQESLCNA